MEETYRVPPLRSSSDRLPSTRTMVALLFLLDRLIRPGLNGRAFSAAFANNYQLP